MNALRDMYRSLGVDERLLALGEEVEASLKERFDSIDRTAEYNQIKVLSAMQKNRVAEAHFSGSTGYGYNDLGRETLEQIYADVFHAEAAPMTPWRR